MAEAMKMFDVLAEAFAKKAKGMVQLIKSANQAIKKL